jgi:hypothetical protein
VTSVLGLFRDREKRIAGWVAAASALLLAFSIFMILG